MDNDRINEAYEKYVLGKSNEVNMIRTTNFNIDTMVVCNIDPKTRKITIPDDVKLAGVMADNNTRRLYFSIPRFVDENDLGDFDVSINYLNAKGEADKYRCTDKQVNDSEVCISWLISEFATKYKGEVKFVLCLSKNTGEHWNTTIGIISIIEGLETSEQIIDQNPQLLEDIEDRLKKLEDSKMMPVTLDEVNSIFKKEGAVSGI